MTKIEEVVRAVGDLGFYTDADRAFTDDELKIIARAAITAIREPNEAMLRAATLAVGWRDKHDNTRKQWQAMVDAMLEEK